MVNFKQALSKKHVQNLASLAEVIWHEHYTSIIGRAQVEYMLAKFQSVEAISDQIKSGFSYYGIFFNQTLVGYLAYIIRAEGLFLSKIYILEDYRRKGIGGWSLEFVKDQAFKMGASKVFLTVNKNNQAAIMAYKKTGFKRSGVSIQDIGQGFIMDDITMEISVF